jgi:hypothetical protein
MYIVTFGGVYTYTGGRGTLNANVLLMCCQCVANVLLMCCQCVANVLLMCCQYVANVLLMCC